MFSSGATLLHHIDRRTWSVVDPLEWTNDIINVTVQPGFSTDLASVPRLAYWIIPRADRHIIEPSVIHDYIYNGHMPNVTRKQADDLLVRMIKFCGGPGWYCFIVKIFVRAFGWIPWNREHKNVKTD